MRVYPFWNLYGEGDAIYRITGFGGLVTEPDGPRITVGIFEGMGGELREVRPYNNLSAFAVQASKKAVKARYPEEWQAWADLPEEDL